MLKLPDTDPINDPASMWNLQLKLLDMAQALLGSRCQSFKICQPEFGNGGPIVLPSPANDAAWRAVLSLNGRGYWPTVVYELAHETIHLLDPVKNSEVNYLEEGVAVAFSIHAQECFGLKVWKPSPSVERDIRYHLAFGLVQALPEGALESAKRVRQKVGRLSDATADDLRDLYDGLEPSIAEKLASKFNEQET